VFSQSEENVGTALGYAHTMVGSDSLSLHAGPGPHPGKPHPRSYGTFPRVLGHYVRERKALKLEEAVRKMTSFPAKRLGLADRGSIREGMKADLVVFDAARVRDTATFDKPHQYPAGIPIVIVNGQVVFEDGSMTAARPGKVLYGPAASQSKP
jgi:N-acyl-D-aspartate/D-glutamate deacylase